MRLIDANELSAEFYSRLMDSVEKIPTKNIIGFIEHATTIDAVPVVRCKNCKYYCLYGNGEGFCTHHISTDDCSYDEHKYDFFCAYGEEVTM